MENQMLDHREIGRRIREERRRQGLRQRDLAAMVGVSESFIGQTERGEKRCSAETLARLSVGLKMDLRRLLLGD